MTTQSEHFKKLYDEKGNLHGVYISPELWGLVEKSVMPVIEKIFPQQKKARPEPIGDWNTLKDYWDFKYPVDTTVKCDICGSATENWETDNPRLFRLMACNLGGQVRFECLGCHARIMKRHFKSHIDVACSPCPED